MKIIHPTIMRFFLAVLLLQAGIANAQDPHLSQFFASPMTLNPALIGKGVAEWRVLGSYRSQWQGGGTEPYTTTTASLEKNLSGGDKNTLGIGLMFLSDASNAGILKNNYLSAGIAYNNALDAEGKQYFGGGLTVNYATRILDASKFLFQSQFGSNGYQASLPSNDYAAVPNRSYIDVNAGLHYSIQGLHTGFYTGVSYFHAARPKNNISSTDEYAIDPRLSVQGGYSYTFSNNTLLQASGIYEHQGSTNLCTMGLLAKLPLPESQLHLRSINIGAWDRVGDAITIYVGLESNSNWIFGCSYDAVTSKIANSLQLLQSLEFSFGWQFGAKKKAGSANEVRQVFQY